MKKLTIDSSVIIEGEKIGAAAPIKVEFTY